MKTNELKERGELRLITQEGEVWSIQAGTRKRFYLVYKKRGKLRNKELKYSEVIDIIMY